MNDLNKASVIDLPSTPQELNNRASQLITQLHQYTFSNLPAILDRIITTKAWLELPTKFNNFGEYALSQSVDGLAIDSNEKLWLLRCAIDANKKHIEEWKDVLLALEELTKAQPKQLPLSQSAISLEKLAKSPELGSKITYHPSRSKGADKGILQLSTKGNDYLNRVANGKLKRGAALKEAGFFDPNKDFYRAKSAINKLNNEDRNRVIEWMTESGYITT
ncbi:hypothetical protein [Candidatus Thioglobus sp.]|uniref:hypothetical protein n=1 Tax=Candidatus Thioglobus sp. TaxID=2026721 RepID=UPI003D0AE44D